MIKGKYGILDTSYLSKKHKSIIAKKNKLIDNIINPVPIKDYVYDVNNDPEILDAGEKEYAYGVLIDFTKGNTDSDEGFITRIGNMEFHKTLPCHTHIGVKFIV